jgi:F0F1-type ATP synthase membrane subunit b/b'
MVAKAESSAKQKSERIVAEAHEEISKEIEKAKKSLESDTLALVKKATSVVTAHVADDKVDAALVKKSVQEAK